MKSIDTRFFMGDIVLINKPADDAIIFHRIAKVLTTAIVDTPENMQETYMCLVTMSGKILQRSSLDVTHANEVDEYAQSDISLAENILRREKIPYLGCFEYGTLVHKEKKNGN